jgi:hypothetical protein
VELVTRGRGEPVSCFSSGERERSDKGGRDGDQRF